MPTDALPLLYNPRAGRGAAPRRIGAIVSIFESAGLDVSLCASSAAGDIERLARQLSDAGTRRLLVAGGDGSIHEAVNGLLASDTPAALGVLALGTGNDFAKANTIPLEPESAATLLADRISSGIEPRAVDAGRLNGRFFANGAGIGFDAEVSVTAAAMRRPAGRVVYLLALLKVLARGIATPRVSLEVDGETIAGQITLAAFNVGPWTGGLFPIAPMAKNDDGRLDLVYADALDRRRLLALLPGLLKGRHIGRPGVHHRSVVRCRLRAEEALPSHLDGENQPPAREFAVDILPGALQLL